MAINVSKVSFKGDQEQQRSGGPGLGTIAATTVVGGAAGVFLRDRKVSLEGLDKDAFIKATKEFTGEDKANADIVKAHLEKPTEEKTDAKPDEKTDAKAEGKETKAEAKTEAKGKTTTRPSIAAEGVTIENIFGKSEELDPKTYLQEKYGFSTRQELIDAIKQQKGVENGSEGAAMRKDIRAAQHNQKMTQEGIVKAKQLVAQSIRGAEMELDVKVAEVARDEITDKTSRAYENAQKKVDALKKKLSDQAAKVEKLEKDLAANKRLQHGSSAILEAAEGVQTDSAFREKLDNVAKNNVGPKAKKEIKAKIEKEAEIKAKKDLARLEREAKEEAKAEKKKFVPMTKEAQEEFISKAKAAAVEANGEKIEAYVKLQIEKENTRRMTAEVNDRIKTAQDRATKESYKDLTKNQREMGSSKAATAEMEKDLALVRDADKNKTKITRAQGEEVLTSTASKAKEGITKATKDAKGKVGEVAGKTAEEAKSAASEGAAKALEAIKKKLPKDLTKFNTKAMVIGGAIGLAAGIVIKWMFGGKSEE